MNTLWVKKGPKKGPKWPKRVKIDPFLFIPKI